MAQTSFKSKLDNEKFKVADLARDKLVYIDETKGRLNVLLNCQEKSQISVDEYASGNDRKEFQFSVLQNVFEFLLPDDWHMKMTELEHLPERIPWELVQ